MTTTYGTTHSFKHHHCMITLEKLEGREGWDYEVVAPSGQTHYGHGYFKVMTIAEAKNKAEEFVPHEVNLG